MFKKKHKSRLRVMKCFSSLDPVLVILSSQGKNKSTNKCYSDVPPSELLNLLGKEGRKVVGSNL